LCPETGVLGFVIKKEFDNRDYLCFIISSETDAATDESCPSQKKFIDLRAKVC